MSTIEGYASGVAAAQSEDAMKQQLAEGNIRLQQEGVNLEAAKIALDSQKKMMELMQKSDMGSKSNGTLDTDVLPNALDQMAQMSMQSGLPGQAADFASKAGTLRKNQAAIQHQQLQDAIKHLTIAADLVSNVHDEDSWNKANATYEMMTGEESPFKGKPYSPEMVEQIQNGVQTAKDKALTAAAQARVKASESEARERDTRVGLIEAQRNLTETRDTNLRKNGGRPTKSDDVRAITDLITRDYAGAYLPEDARVLARPIAERASELMAEQGLSKSAAANKAYQEAKARGDFGGARPRMPGSGTFNKPLELPSEGGKVDKTKIRPNLWYNVSGKPMLYVGGKFYSQQELNAAGEEEEAKDDEEEDTP